MVISAHHGDWRFSGALEPPRFDPRHFLRPRRCRRAPHLIIWALLAGCLWAVANTLTIFAIRDIGLSIAFSALEFE